MAKKEVKEKPKKMSKSNSKEKTFSFFNVLDYKTLTPETLIQSLYDNAEALLNEHGKSVNAWCTFARLEEQVEKTWNSDLVFSRFWLDAIVQEFGYMLWNEVFNKYHKDEWYKKGNLVEVPELPKKLQSNPEAVASHFADAVVNSFKEQYL